MQATNPEAIRLNAIDCAPPSCVFNACAHSNSPQSNNKLPTADTIAAIIV